MWVSAQPWMKFNILLQGIKIHFTAQDQKKKNSQHPNCKNYSRPFWPPNQVSPWSDDFHGFKKPSRCCPSFCLQEDWESLELEIRGHRDLDTRLDNIPSWRLHLWLEHRNALCREFSTHVYRRPAIFCKTDESSGPQGILGAFPLLLLSPQSTNNGVCKFPSLLRGLSQ